MTNATNPYLDIDWLRKNTHPQTFGLGFVQCKLNEKERLHFWFPEELQTVRATELHDHRYGFNSKVLSGYITHEVFEVYETAEETPYVMSDVSCDPELPVEEQWKPVNIESFGKSTYHKGESYDMKVGQFHRALNAVGVTKLTREKIERPVAKLVKPKDAIRFCPFENQRSKDSCFSIMEYVIQEGKKYDENTELEYVNPAPGYHLSKIAKGEIGQISKIQEELFELEDAAKQGATVMELVELSDLYGAIEHYLEKHHPSTAMSDLEKMSNITRRAFENGRR